MNRRGPSAFAPGRLPGGKNIKWESLVNTAGTVYTTFFPNAGPGSTRFRTLLPQDVLNGVVTVERIRGWIWCFVPNTIIDASATDLGGMTAAIQLTPIQNGAIVTTAVLNETNAADKESNRFLWMGSLNATGWNSIPITMDAVAGQMIEVPVDAKSRRRFDRAVWALILSATFQNTGAGSIVLACELRGLFRLAEGAGF